MSSSGDRLSEQLKKFRAADKTRSQEKVAKLFGLSRATINRWEGHGAGSAMLDELDKAAEVMEKAPWLLIRPETSSAQSALAPVPPSGLDQLNEQLMKIDQGEAAKLIDIFLSQLHFHFPELVSKSVQTRGKRTKD